MVTMIGDEGQCFEIKQVFHQNNYADFKQRLGEESYKKIIDYLDKDIAEDKFCVGWKYPATHKQWQDGYLSTIYFACGQDPTPTGMMLGLMVLDVLLHRDEEWLCLKSDLTKKAYLVMFYWKKGAQ